MQRVAAMIGAIAMASITGCGTVERMWRGGPAEQKRVPAGVTAFACDGTRKLLVRFEAGGRSAWVVLPEREFRLDAAQDGPGGHFSNGRTTLTVAGDEASLAEGSTVTFANCKRSAGG